MSLLSFKKLLKLCCRDLHDLCNKKKDDPCENRNKYKITLYFNIGLKCLCCQRHYSPILYYNIVYSSSMYPINLSIKINFNIPTHMFNFLSIPFLFSNHPYLSILFTIYFKLSEIIEDMRFLKT